MKDTLPRQRSFIASAILAAIGMPLIRHALHRQHTALDAHNLAERAAKVGFFRSDAENERISASIAKRERKAAKKAAEANLRAIRHASQS